MFRAITIAAALIATPAAAAELSYTSTLDGVTAPTNTGSLATGQARVSVDTTAQTISVAMTIHRHQASINLCATISIAQRHGPDAPAPLPRRTDDISLIVPFPFGASVRRHAPTASRVAIVDYPIRRRRGKPCSSDLTLRAICIAALGSRPRLSQRPHRSLR
jgi:hypothetical protein